MTAAIEDLQTLIAQMAPALRAEPYLYVELPGAPSAAQIEQLRPFALFHEDEGYSAVVSAADAGEAGLSGEGPFALISLRVHSRLTAVGLTAAIASTLTDAGISANVIAALRHDHLLVAAADGERALGLLQDLARRALVPDQANPG